MKRRNTGVGMPLRAAINVTPIIDVALTLVIILLITAPMLALSDLEVDLPSAVTRGPEDAVKINITLSRTGRIAINERIVEREAFGPLLAGLLSNPGNEDVLVVLRADTEVPYSTIRTVLGEARGAGARRMAIAALQRGGGER
ncbi:MAG: biopolymer transporter ExbD [Candidatus Krumholzibacteria bacterium]|nr:biopolymer transporter ExbD [Candidatus Krumholzibacteria bacterium]